MDERFSARIEALAPSATIAMNETARRLKAEGRDVVDLTVGEPDFPTPAHVIEAGKQALDAGHTRYTSVPGIPELREAICRKLARDNGVAASPAGVVVSSGAKQSLANAMLALVDPGDEVIIPTPAWVSYTEMARLAGGTPVFARTTPESGWRLSPGALEAAVTPRTRLLVLCTPSNPSGVVYSREDLEGLAAVLGRHERVWLLSDEVYERIDWTGRHASPGAIASIASRVVTVGGLSKSHAMTGWRLGWLAAAPDLARAVAGLQGQTTTSASSIAQRAALAALDGPQDEARAMLEAWRRRRGLVSSRLGAMPGIACRPPEGAFYAFPDVSGLAAWKAAPAGKGSAAVAALLLEKALVATVPGLAFGEDRCLRLSFATSDAALATALDRMDTLFGRGGRD